jgi:hypothetical protein
MIRERRQQVNTNIGNFFASYLRKSLVAVAVSVVLCGFSIPNAGSAEQDSGLVTSGSLSPGMERNYAYAQVDGKYPNIFKEQGRMFAVLLIAHQRNGKYVDDTVGVVDLTDPNHPQGYEYPIQVSREDRVLGIDVRFENRHDELWFTVSAPHSSRTRMSYEAPVKAIYQWRLKTAQPWKWCGRDYLFGAQGGTTGAKLFFDPSLSRYLNQEPPDNFRLLAPLYVIPIPQSGNAQSPPMPIADTGCSMYFHNDGVLYSSPEK